MPEPILTKAQADAIVAADPEGPYAYAERENGRFLVLNQGVTEDGHQVNVQVVGRIVEGK